MRQVTPSDEGSYTCVVENMVGKSEASASLTVHGQSLLLRMSHSLKCFFLVLSVLVRSFSSFHWRTKPSFSITDYPDKFSPGLLSRFSFHEPTSGSCSSADSADGQNSHVSHAAYAKDSASKQTSWCRTCQCSAETSRLNSAKPTKHPCNPRRKKQKKQIMRLSCRGGNWQSLN